MSTISGFLALLLLLIRSRFRLRGAYWTWRNTTAFGNQNPLSRGEQFHAILDYARWMGRMRSLRR